ncbi:hypothetical protein BDN72DRAFT_116322 [Pluteus cervinus]|uniref:Uncharacterized protein n=1 Tax=Pluteus cervinus TaxID=181527 RepID=A0ACD3AN60_9AGAR|nr:hypothetical protein BDN72DRAFT_116322 [Pluteus cervinus]
MKFCLWCSDLGYVRFLFNVHMSVRSQVPVAIALYTSSLSSRAGLYASECHQCRQCRRSQGLASLPGISSLLSKESDDLNTLSMVRERVGFGNGAVGHVKRGIRREVAQIEALKNVLPRDQWKIQWNRELNLVISYPSPTSTTSTNETNQCWNVKMMECRFNRAPGTHLACRPYVEPCSFPIPLSSLLFDYLLHQYKIYIFLWFLLFRSLSDQKGNH